MFLFKVYCYFIGALAATHLIAVPLWFQDASSSDLGYYVSLIQELAVIPFFAGIELNRNSSYSNSFEEWPFFVIKEQLKPRIVSNLLCFCRTEFSARNYTGVISVILIHPWFQACIYWKKSLLYGDIISCHPFFLWWSHYFMGAFVAIHMSRTLCLFHNTCWSRPL